MSRLSRRDFLKLAGAAGFAALAGCGPRSLATGTGTPSTDGRPTPRPTGTPAALPEPPKELLFTPQSELYRQAYRPETPSVDAAQWSLTLDGLVRDPITLTYADVLALPKVETTRTLECISNPVGGSLIGNVLWGGFRLGDLLDRVGIRPEAIRAKFLAADEYHTSVDLKWITQPDVLMAYEIDGEPLTPEHGFPLRILMPGLYGQKMPKWITRIEFIDHVHQGFWERQMWSDVAEVQTNSQIRQPRNLQNVFAGRVPLYGLAFAGLRKIVKVEVRVDEGVWETAELLQTDSSLVWTQWTFDWAAGPGKHTVAVRATDETGFVQYDTSTSILDDAFPNGSDNVHAIVVKVSA